MELVIAIITVTVGILGISEKIFSFLEKRKEGRSLLTIEKQMEEIQNKQSRQIEELISLSNDLLEITNLQQFEEIKNQRDERLSELETM